MVKNRYKCDTITNDNLKLSIKNELTKILFNM